MLETSGEHISSTAEQSAKGWPSLALCRPCRNADGTRLRRRLLRGAVLVFVTAGYQGEAGRPGIQLCVALAIALLPDGTCCIAAFM